METTIIRQRLQQFIETAEEEKVKAIYTLLEEQIEGGEMEYSDELKAELDKRTDDYKTGKVKGVSWEEAKEQLLTPVKDEKQRAFV